MNKIAFLAALLISVTTSFGQQLKTPAKSPFCSVKQAVGLADVTVEYCRPSKSGRVVFGDVVPFDKIWRTGANASTKITFGEDVKVNGQALKAGTYALYTFPGKEEWKIVFNKDLTLWGDDGYNDSLDAATILVKTQKLAETVETFTIQFSNTKTTQLTTDLTWENTKVSFDITVEIDEKLTKNIEAAMSQDKRPYHQSAQYFYDNKKDMKKALEWATKAFEINPNAYWSAVLKAKIQLELKDTKGAIATAETAKKLAEADEDGSYVKQAEEIIKQAKTK
ncbi:MAG: DUF2911 domain-containing protein [Bacteroidota bacterium]